MRIVVLRTSRFLGAAVGAVNHRWPGCELRVVYQQGSEAEVRAAGLEPDAGLCVPAGRLSLWRFLRQPAFVTLAAWRPDVVVLQWWNSRGDGHASADRVALALMPGTIAAVLEDGRWQTMSWASRATRGIRRTVVSVLLIGVVAVLTCAAWPSYAWSAWSERRRLSEAA